MKNKKVVVAGVSLSEACALSENHPLSETLNPLSKLGESGGESAKHLHAQCVISSLSESFVFSRAKRAQLAQ